jgi:hypothetical protein
MEMTGQLHVPAALPPKILKYITVTLTDEDNINMDVRMGL